MKQSVGRIYLSKSPTHRTPALAGSDRRPRSILAVETAHKGCRLHYWHRRAWPEDPTGSREREHRGGRILRSCQPAFQGAISKVALVQGSLQDLSDQSHVGYTDFIRTAESRHYKAVEHFWVCQMTPEVFAVDFSPNWSHQGTSTKAHIRDGTLSQMSASTPRRKWRKMRPQGRCWR